MQVRRDYYKTQELRVVPSNYGLVQCLEAMGFEVHHRPIELGEDLSGYRHVICYIHSLQAFAQRMYDGMYVLARRPDAIVAFDDWQMDQVLYSFKKMRRELRGEVDNDPFREYYFELYQGTKDRDLVRSFAPEYEAACDLVLAGKNRLLVSAFRGGDLTKLGIPWDQTRLYRYNPNPFHLNRTPSNSYCEPSLDDGVYDVDTKEFAWNFASLVQTKTRRWLEDQRIEAWPVNFYGVRRGEYRCERLSEADMCRVFNKQWGCLMPGYFHSGSGWWRARPLQVADAGSILVCDPDEGRIYGEPYVGVSARDVESMDRTQLAALATRQSEALYDNHPLDVGLTMAEVREVLEASP